MLRSCQCIPCLAGLNWWLTGFSLLIGMPNPASPDAKVEIISPSPRYFGGAPCSWFVPEQLFVGWKKLWQQTFILAVYFKKAGKLCWGINDRSNNFPIHYDVAIIYRIEAAVMSIMNSWHISHSLMMSLWPTKARLRRGEITYNGYWLRFSLSGISVVAKN